MDTQAFTIRPGLDTHATGFIALIGACWAEYPGIVLDVDAELPELHALATYYTEKGGALWTAEAGGGVVGMIAVVPRDDGIWEICRLYVLAPWRGAGLAHRLLDQAEAHACAPGITHPCAPGITHPRAPGATRLVLWSDTRFERAHRFYERRGYVRAGPIRVLNDLSNSLEFGYAKPVNGVEVLDAAAAASTERCLAEVLTACVADGASVSFLPPLAPDVARAFWRRNSREVAAGGRVLIAGWVDGRLAGCVTLDLDTSPNQRHRAEVQTLLVDPATRRRGLARAMMQRLEVEATRQGRSLLTLDTRAGDTAEALYRGMGWIEAGRIPDYARNADGTLCDTLYFYKRVGM
jgi:ribosomal protein S18 acetylase RimI-like enzyme